MKELNKKIEKYKFKDIFERITTKNEVNNSNILTISAQYGLINQKEFFNKIVASKNLSGYFYLKKNDFAYNKSYSKDYPMGAIKRLTNYEDGVVSPLYICFRLKSKDTCIEFMEYYFESGLIDKEIYKIAQEGARNHGLLNISVTEFFNDINLFLPSYEIQKEYVNILSKISLVIDKQQQLIEKKKDLKKGLMQRLLSGEARFKEFTDEWRTVKLGEIFKERKETGFNDLELLAITIANGVVRRTEVDVKDNSSEDKSKYKRILPGDIGYNTMRMWQGVSGLSKYEGIVSPAYTILKPVENIDSLYMSYLFKTPNVINLFYRYSQGLVSDTLNLKYENFKDIKVKIPSNIEEQKKIAEVLSTADKEIGLLQKELEALKLQKKGLMQRLLTGEVRVNVE